MSSAIRFGLLGAGRVAQDFAMGVTTVPGAQVSAVWSRTPANAMRLNDVMPQIRVASTVESLVADPNVDIVYVATPHHLHADHCIRALKAGKPVLCEKPFATSAAEARRIVDEARSRGLFCMEAMWMRFIPAVQRLKEHVDQGRIGEPRVLYADFGVATRYDPSGRLFDPAMAGGALLDRGVYPVSLAHLLFGAPTEVCGLATSAPSGVDHDVGAVMRFADGPLAMISASLSSTTANTALVVGTSGQMRLSAPFYCSDRLEISSHAPVDDSSQMSAPGRLDQVVDRLKSSRLGSEVVRAVKSVVRRPSVERLPLSGHGYSYEAAEVVRCLTSGESESPIMSLDESIRVMETVDRIRQSIS